ncbi:MAG: hypothetical protein AAB215_08600 [Planctomycetota bacterium]
MDLISRSPDPDASLNGLERLSRSTGGFSRILFGFRQNPRPFERLCWILGASEYFTDVCVRDSEFALDFFWTMDEDSEARMDSDFDEIEADDFADLPAARALAALRRAKRRSILRIGSLDYLGLDSLENSMERISRAADRILKAAFRHVERRILGSRNGRLPLCVLAVGKLGGRELNYSSDVDLIFLHEEQPGIPPERFQCAAEGIVAMLSEVTEDGAAFRVDVRLRPHGIRGPLSTRLERAIDYYRTAARPWERVALVRARTAAGDARVASRFLEAVSPIVYPRMFGHADLEALKALKRRSESEARTRRDPARDLKTGPGGIRDVEFVAQTLCVLYGGKHPALRTGNVLGALKSIRTLGLLPPEEADALADAYRFLRGTEHRVQTLYSLQVYEVPAPPAARAALARRLGFAGSDESAEREFSKTLALHRDRVRRLFDRFLGEPGPRREGDSRLSHWIEAGSADPAEGAEALGALGFRDPARAARCMLEAATPSPGSLSPPERQREAFARIAPRIAQRLGASCDPDEGMARLSRLLTQSPAPATLFEGLCERPAVLDALADIASASPYLADIPAASPESLEPMLQALAIPKGRPIPPAAPGGAPLGAFRATETLRIAARDLTGLSSPAQTMRALTASAEAAVAEAVARASVAGAPRVSILALGRLGGREMGYSSDLDLVFLHDSAADPSACTRVAERIVRILEEEGAGFRVDARLRPGGKSAPLVASLRSFEAYHAGKGGAFWERLALVRARVIAGPPSLARSAGRAAARSAFQGLASDASEAPGLARMRERQEKEADADDLKRGPGGLSDIEFLVSFLQILEAPRRPDVRTPSTRLAISRLARAGVLAKPVAKSLAEAFDLLRLVESRIRIVRGLPQDVLPKDAAARDAIAKRSGFSGAAAMVEALARTRRRVREIFCGGMKARGGTATPAGAT